MIRKNYWIVVLGAFMFSNFTFADDAPLDPQLVKKINRYVVVNLLNKFPKNISGIEILSDGESEDSSFNGMNISKNNRIIALTYDIKSNPPNGEKYIEELDSMNVAIFIFDKKTGREVNEGDFFTENFMKHIEQKIKKHRHQKISEILVEITKEIKKVKRIRDEHYKDSLKRLEEQFDMYNYCEKYESENVNNGIYYEVVDFTTTNLVLKSAPCSIKYTRALDDYEGEYSSLSIPYTKIRPYLSTYGKYALLNEGKATLTSSPFNQVLHGNIGKSPITILLRKESNNEINGVYFYNKYQKPITIHGNINAGKILLEEEKTNEENGTNKPQITARWTLTIQGDKLNGQWQKEEKSYSVNIVPFD